MASLTLPLPPFSITDLFSEEYPFFSMQPPTEELSEESDEGTAFEAEDVRISEESDEGTAFEAEDVRLSEESDEETAFEAEDVRLSEESDEETAFEAEDVRLSQNQEFKNENSEDDIQTPKPHRVVKKRRNPEPKKQTPPVQELNTLPRPNHKLQGTGRRGEKFSTAATTAAKVATDVKAEKTAATVGMWITAATLSSKQPHTGGAAGASLHKTLAKKRINQERAQKGCN